MTAAETHTRPRTLSKSDFKLARTCEAKLYFRENRYPDTGDMNPYMVMLAQGGYMVEALAKAAYADGVQLEYGSDRAHDARVTLEYLQRDEVTLFEATLLWNRRLARADIIQKKGNTVRLIEVKAKSFNSAEHAALIAAGKQGVFCTDRAPFRVRSGWCKYFEDVTYQTLLLERMLPGVTVEPYLALVDKSKRAQVGDIPELFEIIRHTGEDGITRVDTARFKGDPSLLPQLDLLTVVDASQEVSLLRDEVEESAARFEALLDAPLGAYQRSYQARCRECEFRIPAEERNGFRECWGELALPKPHVLDLFSIGKVNAARGVGMVEWLTGQGKASLFDIPVELLKRSDGKIGAEAERRLRQIAHARSGEFWMSPELEVQIERVEYPAHFVDFEAANLALPYHAGMPPYGQVAFQWSSHTTAAPGANPVHGEWLNTERAWPNERFARKLREQVGDSGSVLTWSKFERTTLRGIIRDLTTFGVHDPELADWIGDVAENRIVDMNEWAVRHFYHPAMGGRTSIKVVLDSLWQADGTMRAEFERWTGLAADPAADPYAALLPLVIDGVLQNVSEGTGAIRAYEAMMYGVEKNDEEAKARWRQLLLQYCALDSLSMVLIFEHLRRRVAC